MPKIPGGYYLKARKIQESKIAHAPPHIREIWDWLLKEANHQDKKYSGFIIKRGQLFRTYKEIREGLHWMIGYRKMMYNENHTKKAMKFLRENQMITTTKELGGVLITILNYDFYQNPKNYERTDEKTNERTNAEPMRNHTLPDNNKNDKNDKNKYSYERAVKIPSDFYLTDKMKSYAQKQGLQDQSHLDYLFKSFVNWWTGNGKKKQDWTRTFYNWILNDKKKYNPDKYKKVIYGKAALYCEAPL